MLCKYNASCLFALGKLLLQSCGLWKLFFLILIPSKWFGKSSKVYNTGFTGRNGPHIFIFICQLDEYQFFWKYDHVGKKTCQSLSIAVKLKQL